MDDERKTKAELIAELRSLREEVNAVVASEISTPEVQRFPFTRTVEVFRHLMETMGAMVVRLDARGKILAVGPSIEPVLGLKPKALLNRAAFELIAPEDHERAATLWAQLIRDGSCAPFRLRVPRAHGETLIVEFGAVAQPEEGEEVLVTALVRDVTAETAARAAAAESEDRHRILAEASRDLINETCDGRFIYLSSTCSQVLGYEPEELLGRDSAELFHPDDLTKIAEQFQQTSEDSDVFTYTDFRMRHKSGAWRWYEGTSVRFLRPDGLSSVVGTLRDVTERTLAEAEAQRLQERMQQAQKLETLGIMAGGIAHDFGNLLTPILGHAALAVNELPENSSARARLEKIRSAASRAATLTNQMLAFAGGEPVELDTVDLSALVRDVRDVLADKLPEPSRVRLRTPDDLPAARADASQVMQVVMNLIINAAEAIDPERGAIAIRTGSVLGSEIPKRSLVVGEADAAHRYVFVSVTDTGSGLEEATRERIFDPFYTTKFTGRGLGLAAVLGIVRAHDGCIDLRSKPRRGTRFRVFLRTSEPSRDTGRARPQPPRRPAAKADEVVIVADDDRATREFLSETLRRAGLQPIAVGDGREAVAELERRHRDGDAVAAVVMDRTMPTLDGVSALESMREFVPRLPAVLVTGHAAASSKAPLVACEVLEKPFLPDALVEALQRVMSEEADACVEV